MHSGFTVTDFIIIILVLIALVIYMVPSNIYKGHNKLAFKLINIFLGWTGAVWITLLIIALLSKEE
jgi:uncharacterized membrane protein